MDRSRAAAILSAVEQAGNCGAHELLQKSQAIVPVCFSFWLRSKSLLLLGAMGWRLASCILRAHDGVPVCSGRKPSGIVASLDGLCAISFPCCTDQAGVGLMSRTLTATISITPPQCGQRIGDLGVGRLGSGSTTYSSSCTVCSS